MRRTFSSELGHDNKSEVMCMCPTNAAVVRAFRPEPTAKTGEVSSAHYRRLRPRSVKGKDKRSQGDVPLNDRTGKDGTTRSPLVVEALNHPKVRSCLINGEAVCCDAGSDCLHLLRQRRNEPQ
jgi:hypothetical protein